MKTSKIISEIKKDILLMVKMDQDLRYNNKLDTKLDKINAEKLKKILSNVGWPKISQFGKKVSNGTWLLVQHSDHDLGFQKKCLRLIKEATKEKEIDIKLLPLLEDRVLVNQGKKQKYGTQFFKDKKTGELKPKPIKNKNLVDVLRKSVGLEPLDIYSKKLNNMVKRIEDINSPQS